MECTKDLISINHIDYRLVPFARVDLTLRRGGDIVHRWIRVQERVRGHGEGVRETEKKRKIDRHDFHHVARNQGGSQ